MNDKSKPLAAAELKPRSIVARDGKVLVAKYKSQKQASDAAAVIKKRHDALIYLSKR